MGHPFSQYDDAIAVATDELSRRRLMAEIGRTRAANLHDAVALRAAGYALATVHDLVGDRDAALREARQLVALCEVAPAAPAEARQAAERLLGRLMRQSPEGRQARERDREARWSAVFRHADAGAFDAARAALVGSGVKPALARVWLDLAEARASGDPAAVGSVIDGLRARLGPVAAAKAAASRRGAPLPAREAPADPRSDRSDRAPDRAPEGPVETLVGAPLPSRRQPRVRAMRAWSASHPAQRDALAAAALREHVAAHGPRTVAPWLFPVVLDAFAGGDAPDTRAALAELADAFAVTAYTEPGFSAAVEVARALGAPPRDVRRGVTRSEPADRVLWGVETDTGEIVVGGEATGPWPDDVAGEVARRLAGRPVVVVAPGEAHAGLRAACEAGGVALAPDVAAAVSALASAPAAEPASDRPRGPSEPDGPHPVGVLRALLAGETPPAVEALVEPLRAMRRISVALRSLARDLEARAPEAADPLVATLMDAIHEAAPADVRPVAAMRLALEIGSAVPDGEVAARLAAGDARAARFGGAQASALRGVLTSARAEGWRMDRLEVGADRRETAAVPGLGELVREMRGLWRVRLVQGEAVEHLWWVADPSPEAVAAIPLLLPVQAPDRVLALDAASAEAVRALLPSVAVVGAP